MLLRKMRVYQPQMLKLATFMEAFSTAGRMSALQMRDGYIACQSEGMAMHLSLLAEVFRRHAREMYELGATNKDFSVFAAVASTQPSPLTELTLEGFPRTSKDDTDACTDLQPKIIWNAGKEVMDIKSEEADNDKKELRLWPWHGSLH